LTEVVNAAVSGAVVPQVAMILNRMSAMDLLGYAMVVEATDPLRVFNGQHGSAELRRLGSPDGSS